MTDDRITFDEASRRVSLLLKGLNEYDPEKESGEMNNDLVPNIKITKLREYEIAMICPFCGTVKNLGMGEEFAKSGYFVSCMECPKVRGPLRASRESAVKAWNDRKGDPSPWS